MGQTYQEAIENSNIVSKTNAQGVITFVNEEFCKISGYTKEELIGSNHNIIRHPEVPKEVFKELWETILSKKPYKTTAKNLCKNGNTVYLNTTITPILDENDEIKEFIAIRYDVTKEVELKKNLEKKDEELKILNQTLEHRVKEQTKQLLELNQTLEHRVQEEILKDYLSIPPQDEIHAILPIGYAKESPKNPVFEDLMMYIIYNSFGNKENR